MFAPAPTVLLGVTFLVIVYLVPDGVLERIRTLFRRRSVSAIQDGQV